MLQPDTVNSAGSAEVDWIPLTKIFTDHAVNTRPVDPAWVDARVAGFDPDKLGIPVVSERPNGRYACLDGQNRIELCRRVGWGDQKIQCKVFHGLTLAQEAALFLGHNDNRQVKSFHKFIARVTAGDPDAVIIAAIVAEAGWELSYYAGEKKIGAVSSLEQIWRTGPAASRGTTLTTTLRIATEAWGHSADASNGQVLRGIGLVVNRYGTLLDSASLVRKLQEFRGGPLGVLSDARGLHAFSGGTVAACVAETIVRIYNSRRRTGALPPWRTERTGE